MKMPTDTFRDEVAIHRADQKAKKRDEYVIFLAKMLQDSAQTIGPLSNQLPNFFPCNLIDELETVIKEVAARLRNDCQVARTLGRLRIVKMIVDEALREH